MERTKYTPKRLLSLLLALIMLLGMFPTAVFAAEETTRLIGSVNGDGLSCELSASFSNGPHFAGEQLPIKISYKFTTQTNPAEYVKQINSYSVGIYPEMSGAPYYKEKVNTPISAESETDSGKTESITTTGSTPITVYKQGTVIKEGSFDITGTIGENGAVALNWEVLPNFDVVKNETVDTGKQWTPGKVRGECMVPLTYKVEYKSDLTGAAGLDTTTHYTTTEDNNQVFTIKANDPTLDNYKFKGWALNGDTSKLYKKGEKLTITANATLTAQWEVGTKHAVKYYYNFPDGSNNSLFTAVHVADGEGAENPGAPYKHPEGYIFKDWCVKAEDGGEVTLTPYDFAAPVTKDIELYADWTQVTEETTYTVTFDVGVANAGPVPGTQVVKKDDAAIEPTTEPTRDGYAFAGWYLVQANGTLANSAYVFTTPVTGNITLRAKWNRNTVNITWPALPTGVYEIHHPKAPYYEGSTVSFNVVWMKGYTPSTVLANGQPLGAVTSTDTEGYEVTTYTFTADADPIKVEINPAVKKTYTITLPSGNGFYAIFSESNKPDAVNAMSYTFEYGDTFKIKFVAQAGMQAQLFVNGKQHLSLPDGGEITCTDTHTVTGDCVVSAFAIQRVFHTVTYVLEPYSGLYTVQSVEHGQATSAPAEPKIPGYEFKGWYSDANLTDPWAFAEADTPDKITRDTVIYGQLTPKTYAVSYDANANGDATVNGIPAAQTKTHGVALPLTMTNPTRDGHTFKGWATSPTGPVAYQPGGQYLNDAPVTLYAVWEKLTYTVTISSGAGYSTVPAGAATVNWHDPFTFTVNVDRQYAAKEPTVVDSVEGTLTAKTGEVNHTGATSYTYEIGKNHKN